MVDGVRAMPEFESVPEIIQAGKVFKDLRYSIYAFCLFMKMARKS
jgi:hypothetical protein